ncbi:hypothetical protein HMN09_00646600 [Mycena chlorophos]|uniref:F-box domain-containing protein n=1 Tax=Mycena chlorophos TaxID=658473 RepID=A0A8H6T620_MYCCL|nr:hypothetical protein HMN09_00646600 [Mycena chlorophos]
MHHCLKIPELLQTIVSFVESDSALLSLAQTRLFHEPALDSLWENPGYEGLHRFLACFPRGIFRFIHRSKNPARLQAVVPLRPIAPDHWTRPNEYARRIRKLKICPSSELSKTALPLLFVFLPTSSCGVLFPRLRELCCSFGDEDEASSVHLLPSLLAPTLSSLSLECHASPERTNNVLAAVAPLLVTRDFCLTRFTIYCSRRDSDPSDSKSLLALVPFLAATASLKVLDICGPCTCTWEAIAELPHLTNLTIWELKALDWRRPSPDRTPFPSLTTLWIYHAVISGTNQGLFDLFRMHRLERLKIDAIVESTTAEMTHLVESLSRTLSHHALIRLDLTCDDPCPVWTLERSTILMLACFSNLQMVQMTAADFNNKTLRAMARCWPHLRRLELSPAYDSAYPGLTIAALLPLAQYCPELFHLSLCLDASDQFIPQDADVTISQHNMRTIYLQGSPIKSPQLVAGFLLRIFPGLCQVYDENGVTTEEEEMWGQVDEIVRENFE